VEDKIDSKAPFIFGLDYASLSNLMGDLLVIRNCDKWFLTSFDDSASQ